MICKLCTYLILYTYKIYKLWSYILYYIKHIIGKVENKTYFTTNHLLATLQVIIFI